MPIPRCGVLRKRNWATGGFPQTDGKKLKSKSKRSEWTTGNIVKISYLFLRPVWTLKVPGGKCSYRLMGPNGMVMI